MRRLWLPLVWICLGACVLAGTAAAQAPDYRGDDLAGGPESYRDFGDPTYRAPARTNGKRPGSLERERTGSPYEADGRRRASTVEPGYEEVGTASWYGAELEGWRTTSGERFDPSALTAAHPTLPMHSLVEVTNRANGRDVIVRVNDRSPYDASGLIAVSHAAAEVLGFVRDGHARVRVRYLGPSPDHPQRAQDVGDGRRDGGGEYVVQVGAYVEYRNARRAHDRVVADGWPVVVDTLPRRYRGLFRIRVGPWESYEEASAMRHTLLRRYPDAFVTTR